MYYTVYHITTPHLLCGYAVWSQFNAQRYKKNGISANIYSAICCLLFAIFSLRKAGGEDFEILTPGDA